MDGFSTEFDSAIEEVKYIPENYGWFIELLRVVSRRHIPSGCRSNYIHGLTEDPIASMKHTKDSIQATLLANNLEKIITSADLTHNSRKA